MLLVYIYIASFTHQICLVRSQNQLEVSVLKRDEISVNLGVLGCKIKAAFPNDPQVNVLLAGRARGTAILCSVNIGGGGRGEELENRYANTSLNWSMQHVVCSRVVFAAV